MRTDSRARARAEIQEFEQAVGADVVARIETSESLQRVKAFGDTLPGLWLAGDWVDDEYPATLETAVRSGLRAARAAAAAAKAPRRGAPLDATD